MVGANVEIRGVARAGKDGADTERGADTVNRWGNAAARAAKVPAPDKDDGASAATAAGDGIVAGIVVGMVLAPEARGATNGAVGAPNKDRRGTLAAITLGEAVVSTAVLGMGVLVESRGCLGARNVDSGAGGPRNDAVAEFEGSAPATCVARVRFTGVTGGAAVGGGCGEGARVARVPEDGAEGAPKKWREGSMEGGAGGAL
jgi:hypothetical protein